MTDHRRLHISIMTAVCIAAGLIILVAVMIAVSVRETVGAPDLAEYPVKGIDISAHNGEIDFSGVIGDSVKFVYIKATEGANFRDSRFHDNYYAAREAGLKVGAYHFYRFDRQADIQAVNLLHMLRGKEFDLPLVIDVEEWTNPDDISDLRVIDGVSRMVEYLTSRGYPVIVYSNKNDYDRYFRRRFLGTPIWICSFIEPPTDLDWTFLQYSHRGSVSGVKGAVDLNVFAGNDSVWQSSVNQWKFEVH